MIDPERELVIVAPPRCGSHSVEAVLLPEFGKRIGFRHLPLPVIHEGYPYTREWRTAILVRNPRARLWSLYHYCQRYTGSLLNETTMHVKSFSDFESFVLRGDFQKLADEPLASDRGINVWPMSHYDPYEDAVPIHLENLRHDLSLFVGHWVEVPHLHRTPPKWKQPKWTLEMLDRVAQEFKEDFRRYGGAP